MSNLITLPERLLALAQDATRGTEFFVLDVRVRGGGGRTQVEIIADTDAGIGIEDLARLSRQLGFVFDTHEALTSAYQLNVLSPGAKEPLAPRQYPRHVGRTLDVRLKPVSTESPGESIEGVLQRVTDQGIVLELTGGTERSIAFDDIERARVKLPW